jgi:hypothetical protein
VHLTIAVAWRDNNSWVIQSVLEFPRGRYRIPAPLLSQLQNSVSIDIEVDAQAINGGASRAGVSAADWLASSTGTFSSRTQFRFEDVPARQSPGAILAWAADAQANQVLFSLLREDELIADKTYAMVVDQAAQGIDVSQRAMGTDIFGVSLLPGVAYGPVVYLESDSPTPSLNILTGEPGEQVLLSAYRRAADPDFLWLRLEDTQSSPAAYTPDFWEAAVDLQDYDASSYTLAFNQTAGDPALAASTCGVSTRNNDFATWCLYAPASRQELLVPSLPADLAADINRDQLQGMRENFQLAREDNYTSYAAWVSDTTQQNDGLGGASVVAVANRTEASVQEPPACLVEVAALGLCLNLPGSVQESPINRTTPVPPMNRPTLIPANSAPAH